MLGLPRLAWALLILWARRTRRFPCLRLKAGGWIRLMEWWRRMTFRGARTLWILRIFLVLLMMVLLITVVLILVTREI